MEDGEERQDCELEEQICSGDESLCVRLFSLITVTSDWHLTHLTNVGNREGRTGWQGRNPRVNHEGNHHREKREKTKWLNVVERCLTCREVTDSHTHLTSENRVCVGLGLQPLSLMASDVSGRPLLAWKCHLVPLCSIHSKSVPLLQSHRFVSFTWLIWAARICSSFYLPV